MGYINDKGEYIHVAKDGYEIPLSKMSDDYLMKMYNFIKKKIREGMYKKDEKTGEWMKLDEWQIRKLFGYCYYRKEVIKRGLIKELIHVTRDGKEIKLSEMTDEHLINTIRFIENKAKDGIEICREVVDIIEGDAEVVCINLTEQDALREMRYHEYVEEAFCRGILKL